MNQNYITPASENTSADYTIPAFAEPITSLPDTPACSASELKRRFQAPSEELRQAHNALAKCVAGITSATYPETVTEAMLAGDLAQKINGKAEQSDLDTETAALDSRVSSLETKVQQTSYLAAGTYTGTGTSETKTVSVGFTPKAVLVVALKPKYEYNRTAVQLAVQGADAEIVKIVSGGFTVTDELNDSAASANPFRYLALK